MTERGDLGHAALDDQRVTGALDRLHDRLLEREVAVLAVTLGRDADVAQPARDHQPAAERLHPVEVDRPGLPHRRVPVQRDAGEPGVGGVEPAVGQQAQLDPALDPQVDRAAPGRAPVGDERAHGGGDHAASRMASALTVSTTRSAAASEASVPGTRQTASVNIPAARPACTPAGCPRPPHMRRPAHRAARPRAGTCRAPACRARPRRRRRPRRTRRAVPRGRASARAAPAVTTTRPRPARRAPAARAPPRPRRRTARAQCRSA